MTSFIVHGPFEIYILREPSGRSSGTSTNGRKSMFEFILQHQFWAAVGVYWVFSAAVSALPKPNGNAFYLWLYQFMHTVAGNITTVFPEAARFRACASRGGKIPGLKTLAASLLLSCVGGCAAVH